MNECGDVISKYNNSSPIKIKYINKEEYCLKQSFFNPSKSTPPNEWNKRLQERIGNSYEYKHLCTMK
jgi:hypothetical protein